MIGKDASKPLVLHVHSDPKFFFEFDYWSQTFFTHAIAFIGNVKKVSDKYQPYLIPLPQDTKPQIEAIIQYSQEADIIVIHSLDSNTQEIVLAAPHKTKVLWRFFGWEIYGKIPYFTFSPRTLKASNYQEKKKPLSLKLKMFIWRIINGTPPKTPFLKAVDRIDYFMGMIKEEHHMLKDMGFNLPPFIQVPYDLPVIEELNKDKEDLIILGNSRNKDNNHLDLLDKISGITLPKSLKVQLFFSYGKQENYAKEVKDLASKIPNIQLEENFMSKDEFNNVYKNAKALIINGYRQMALANIFVAITMGAKIYLSEKNKTYDWLNNIGVKVFSVEQDLLNDLKNQHYTLDSKTMFQNKHNLELFFQNSAENFNNKVLEII